MKNSVTQEMLEAKLRRELELERVQNGARGPMALAVLRKLNVCRGGFTFEAAMVIAFLGDVPSPPKFLRRWGFIRKMYQQDHYLDFQLALKELHSGKLISVENGRYSIDQEVIDAIGEDKSAYQRHLTYYLGLANSHDEKQSNLTFDIESANLEIAFERTVAAGDMAMSYALAKSCLQFRANRQRYEQYIGWLMRVGELVSQAEEKFQAEFAIMFGLAIPEPPPDDPTQYFQHAISAYERALAVFTAETRPSEYSILQNNVGIVYGVMALYEERELSLKRSKAAYEEALRFIDPDTVPLTYGTTQNNLGGIFCKLAMIEDRTENLRRAIAAYKEALRFRTAERTPLSYAKTQVNLSVALFELAAIEDEADNMQRAITASQEALRFVTSETASQEYAKVQLNLGNVYKLKDNDEAAIQCWCEAERCYRRMGAIEDAEKMAKLVAEAGGTCE